MTMVTLASLAELPRWVGWRNELRNNKPTKLPRVPRTGKMAKSDDPGGWGSRPEAEAWAGAHLNGSGGGVGLQLGAVLGQDYSLGGIDLDTCRNPATGAVEPWALQVVKRFRSYTEISPSSTGIKIFFRYANADLAELRRVMRTEHGKQFKRGAGDHPPAIELHLGNRYFAVTDQHLDDTPAELRLVESQTLLWLLTEAGPAFRRSGAGQSELDARPLIEASAGANCDSKQDRTVNSKDPLLARLHDVMGRMPRLAARWQGSTDGLQDASRSGLDMSMTALLRQAGFSFEDTRALLLGWPYGAGSERADDDRYFRRMWDRAAESGRANETGRPAETSCQESGAIGADEETWPEPVDFLGDAELTGSPELSRDHLPEALYAFVTDTAARMGVDPVSVAVSALVTCSSVASDEWRLQPKQNDNTWTENPRLWGAIVGDPSVLKTPVIRICTDPLDLMDAEARRRHASDMRRYDANLAAWKAAGSDPTTKPNAPRLDRYLVEGTTVEALSEVLRSDSEAKQRAPAGKVLVRQDEMAEWLAGFDQYRKGGRGGSDRGAFLRLYNGGRYTIDRVARGSFAVPNWSACVLGGIQPEPIQRIAREAADDGLLQRFIYCVPKRQEEGEDRAPDKLALSRYEALVPALAALHPAAEHSAAGQRPRAVIVLHAEAHRHRLAIRDLAMAMSALPDTSQRLRAAFDKWPGLFARLALTFHLIDTADAAARNVQEPVRSVLSEATAKRAAGFMREILLPHLLRAEAVMFSTAQTGHARWIAGLILARRQSRITLREVVQAYGSLRAPECRRELLEVMESLVTVGWLRPEPQSNPARPPAAWEINPAVFSAFTVRAEQEQRARANARQRITDAIARAAS